MDPDTCAAARIIIRDDVRFVFLYTPGTEANYAAFRSDAAAYRIVFENSQITIYAPRQAWLRQCVRGNPLTAAPLPG